MSIKLTTEQFIQKAREVHGNLYDYPLVEYTNNKSKIKIICKDHGEFLQIPSDHLNGSGCKACWGISVNKERSAKAASEFTTKANIIHNNTYDYSLVEYTQAKEKVKIVCPIHGIFEQSPSHHLQGKGCALCAVSDQGWTKTHFANKCTKNNNSKGILYILECYNENERFIKIGITSNSVKKRYDSKTSMPYSYTVLHEIVGSPEYIYDLETLLHRKSRNYKYIPNTYFAGSSTECFEANPTYLDKLNNYLDFNINKQEEK